MLRKRVIILSIVAMLLAVALDIEPSVDSRLLPDDSTTKHTDSPPTMDLVLSADTRSGVFNPLEIRQEGISTESTGFIHTRTDTQPVVQSNLTLDTGNGWMSNQVEVNVSSLSRLYALNGTFDNGIPGNNSEPSGGVANYPLGWDARSLNDEPTKQSIYAGYSQSSGRHIQLWAEGESTGHPQDFKFYKNSHVYWYQEIDNSMSETNFLLSMDYLYHKGPIGTRQDDDMELRIEVGDGSTTEVLWSIDPTTIPARDVWQSLSPVPVSITGLQSTFEIRIVFEIIEDRTFEGDREDFDGDWDNARYVFFYFDDVSFIAADSPGFEEVDLAASLVPVGTVPITGLSGTGRLLINHSNWETNLVTLTVSSNTTVSFDYEARFVSVFRNLNSTWTPENGQTGLSYTAQIGLPTALTAYVYVPLHTFLQDFEMKIDHPSDYVNATVYNAFSEDVTTQSTVVSGSIQISGSVLDNLGWWHIEFDAPNYAQQTTSQLWNETSSSWTNESWFRSGNLIRFQALVANGASIPSTIEDVSADWFLPNGSIWTTENLDGLDGEVNGSALVLGPYNATPGMWSIEVFWENGTEVAFDRIGFSVNHSTTLSPVSAAIDAQIDTNVTGAVTFTDADSGKAILDLSAIVVGNWSGHEIYFRPNIAKDWWEADFNTTLTGTGNFTVVVNSSLSFYEDATCTFEIRITSDAELEFMGDEYVEIGIGATYSAILRYQYLDGTGIPDASVKVESWTGPSGGLGWGATTQVGGQSGNYSIEFSASLGGQYHVTVSGSKEKHKTAFITFALTVGDIQTELLLLNDSVAAINAESNYTVVVQYLNSTGEGLAGADVGVVSMAPDTGLNSSTSTYHGNGTYSIILHPVDHGTFSLIIGASLVNHQSKLVSFTLTVSPLASILSLEKSADQIAPDKNYTLILTFQDESLVGLENATITVLSVIPAAGIDFSNITDVGGGNYSITLIPLIGDDYEIVFRATLPRYQSATTVFTLYVTDAETTLRTSNGLNTGNAYYNETLEITLLFERTDFPANISLATIEVIPSLGVNYNVTEQPDGYYLRIRSTDVRTHFLTIRASRPGYQTSGLDFTFVVEDLPTTVVGMGPPDTMYSGIQHSFTLWFNMSDIVGIESATVNITYTPFEIRWRDAGGGFYEFNFTTGDLGDYSLSIIFSKHGYASVHVAYTFEVKSTPTTIDCIGKPDVFYLTRSYYMAFFFNSNLIEGVEGAQFTPSPDIGNFYSFQTQSKGWYNFTLTPSILGERNATFHLQKRGFEPQTFSFIMTVEAIPIAIATGYELNLTRSASEYGHIDIELRLIANDTQESIVEADVAYYITDFIDEQNVLSTGQIPAVNGLFSARMEMPGAGGYVLNITISKTNYKTLTLTILLNVGSDIPAAVLYYAWVFLPGGGPLIALVTAVALGRRAYKKKTVQRKLELLAYESRFDDANNIIGFFVIHRNTGLPVYSKVFKGGLEEALVSGFISAISLFRSEFKEEERLWVAIPISEIITAVQTEMLICAVMTTGSPSSGQTESLESFGRSIGALLDDETEILTRMTTSPEGTRAFERTIDQIFGECLDGSLLDKYTGIDREQLTRRYRPLERLMTETDISEGVTPNELVKRLVLAGTDELTAYSLVVEAIGTGLLTPLEEDSHLVPAPFRSYEDREEGALSDDEEPTDSTE